MWSEGVFAPTTMNSLSSRLDGPPFSTGENRGGGVKVDRYFRGLPPRRRVRLPLRRRVRLPLRRRVRLPLRRRVRLLPLLYLIC